jgi:nicotinamide-nucleotide amidase
LKTLQQALLEHIGEYMYADEGSTLEEVVIKLLAKGSNTLAIAEVASSGAIAASFSDVERASEQVLGGFVSISNARMAQLLNTHNDTEEWRNGPGNKIAEAMAIRVRDVVGSDRGLAVTELEAGEDGRRFVWVALSHEGKQSAVKRVYLRGTGSMMRDRLVSSTLDFLRRQLKR